MAEQEHTDAERLKSAEITLATIRQHAGRRLTSGTEHARGYNNAMAEILAILDARWLPEGAPVVFGTEADRG